MRDRCVHVQILQVVLLVRYDDVHVVAAAYAVVGYAQQAVRVWWEVDAHDFGRFVGYDVQEAGVLVREAVVVLAPDGGCEEDV